MNEKRPSPIASDEKARDVIECLGGTLTYFGTITNAFTQTYHNTALDPFQTSLHLAEEALEGLYEDPRVLHYLGGLFLAAFATKDICVAISEKDETPELQEIREALEQNGDLASESSEGKRTIYFTEQLTGDLSAAGWKKFDPREAEELVCKRLGVDPGSFNYDLALDDDAMFPVPSEEEPQAPQNDFLKALKKQSDLSLN
ncbi:MAG: hypothetical protein PHE27_02300 [Alphaproteobacteria bacterium]|nr:hypothetical protein [Alphaproteobacteria bacterium]